MLCENSELPTSVLTLFMKNNYLPYLRLRTAVYAAHMGITTQNTANIPIILVITANIDNLISLTDIPTVSRMIYFLSQPIVAMHCTMIYPIDMCPVITQCRILIRVLICLDLVHRIEISLVRYHRHRIALVTWVEGLLATAAPMVTVGQVAVDLAGEITVADTVVLVRIVV